MEPIQIGKISNYYGCLSVLEHEGKFYWIIENYDTDFSDLAEYEEISEELYRTLLKHNEKK